MAEQKQVYLIIGGDLEAVKQQANFIFQQLADRLDAIEGIRGTATLTVDLNGGNITGMTITNSTINTSTISGTLVGTLTGTVNGNVNGGVIKPRDLNDADPVTNKPEGVEGETAYNSNTIKGLFVCTATGGAGAATWEKCN